MNNTVFVRLSGPMQSWGTGSKLQIRRSDQYPSKSGVLGLVLCAMGVNRDAAPIALGPLVELEMGVRVDRPGVFDWDYHTAGAGIGIRKAEGGVKLTATTKAPETLLSRRQYLLDASFLVALRGDESTIQEIADALRNPVWPVFLGRKCCVATEPILAGTGKHPNLVAALESMPFYVGSGFNDGGTEQLDAVVEHRPGSPPPDTARMVYDVPRTLRYPSHGPRWVVPMKVSAPRVASPRISRIQPGRARVDYTSDQWKAIRKERLAYDNELCVFCKSPAEEVHHVTYENAGRETLADLRSLCRICHDACTQLEYGGGMQQQRIDPTNPGQRETILRQITLLLTSRRLGRRRAILENTRVAAADFLSDAPG
jgi:CRISPR system Cascade subunit CasD